MRNKLIVAAILLIVTALGFVIITERTRTDNTLQDRKRVAADHDSKKVHIVDFHGKEREVRLPVKRAVVLSGPATLQAIRILDAVDKVIGVSSVVRESNYLYPTLDELPVLADAMTGAPDYESIVALKPDVILASYWFDQEMENLLGPNIQIIRFDIGPPLTYSNDVRTLAAIFEKQQRAEEYIAWYEAIVNGIKGGLSKTRKNQMPRVFGFYGGENGLSDGPPYGTYGQKNPWVTPLISMAGGSSISGDLKGDWIIVDPEWVIKQNPGIIVRDLAGAVSGKDVVGYDATSNSSLKAMYQTLLVDSPLSLSDAAKNKRVHFIDSGLVQTQWFLALPYLVKWFNPVVFADLNPEQYHQEYLTRFLGIDYNLKKKGVFVFPE